MRHPPVRTAVSLAAMLLAAACAAPGPGDSAPAPEEPGVERDADEAPAEEPATAAPSAEAAGADATPPREDTPAEAPPPAPDPLRDPDSPAATGRAPDSFRARFHTTAGDFVIEVVRDWAPRGADRFYNLVRIGFYDDTWVYRVVDGSLAQFGIHGEPEVTAIWSWAEIEDDPVFETNRRGRVAFASAGADTRTTQVFINTGDNTGLDRQGFAPIGRVVEGMEVVDALHAGYGDGPPFGDGPDPARIEDRGNAYLEAEFPELDRILEARVE